MNMDGRQSIPSIAGIADVIYADRACQNRIQASSTLAYAFVQIRSGRLDIARHVLAALPTRTEPEMKEVLFALEVFLETCAGDFGWAKEQLAQRLQLDPLNGTLLSLLQAVVWEECRSAGWDGRPGEVSPQEEPAAGQAGLSEADGIEKMPESLREIAAPVSAGPVQSPQGESEGDPEAQGAISPALYQSVLQEENALAFVSWNRGTGFTHFSTKREDLAGVERVLPGLIAGAFEESCRRLEGGAIRKAVLQFERLCLVSLHHGDEGIALVTENPQKAQLCLVRMERIFQQRTGQEEVRPGPAPSYV